MWNIIYGSLIFKKFIVFDRCNFTAVCYMKPTSTDDTYLESPNLTLSLNENWKSIKHVQWSVQIPANVCSLAAMFSCHILLILWHRFLYFIIFASDFHSFILLLYLLSIYLWSKYEFHERMQFAFVNIETMHQVTFQSQFAFSLYTYIHTHTYIPAVRWDFLYWPQNSTSHMKSSK